jgi:threonine dehydrogenase-like Zn-dependent dehydrogenase
VRPCERLGPLHQRLRDGQPDKIVNNANHQVMGPEYVGAVEEIGSAVKTMQVGDVVADPS